MDQHREDEIICEVLLGDVQAFELLVRAYQGSVYNLALRKVRDSEHAADVAQEIFVKAYEKLDRFKTGRRFFPWLYSVGLNVCRDWLRKQGRSALVYTEFSESLRRPQDRFEDQRLLENHVDGRQAFEHVMSLEEKYREALMLRYKHDLSMQEVARALGIGISAAKMRVQRGLAMVRDMLREGCDDH